MKQILYSITAFFLFVLVSNTVIDARVLPRFGGDKMGLPTTSSSSNNQFVSAKLRTDRKALIVNFINLQNAKSVEYLLTYSGSGADQGVPGTLDLSAGNSISRTIIFGTESKGVFTYHTNIKNMRSVVTVVTKAGKTVVKKYVVKP